MKPLKRHFEERAREAQRAEGYDGNPEPRWRHLQSAVFNMAAAGLYCAGTAMGAGLMAGSIAFMPTPLMIPLALPLTASFAGSTAVMGYMAFNAAADATGHLRALLARSQPTLPYSHG